MGKEAKASVKSKRQNTPAESVNSIVPNTNQAKRLAIFFFYDNDGIVDSYVDYLLKGLTEVIDDFVVVVNGKLSPDGRDLFRKYTQDIIVRDNIGLDVWAYKSALEFVGWEKLRQYDEVVLLNHTIMGPVFPFSEMFNKMAQKKNLDFWGATRHLKIPFDPFGCSKFGYIPEHIQSSFMVYRKRFLETPELQYFWSSMPPINSYNESIGYYESYFTKHFADMGFRWDTYVDDSDREDFTNYLLMVAPRVALEEYRCPFFKRRSFFQEPDYCYVNTSGEAAQDLLDFLRKHTDYDINLIYENLIRTANQYDLVRTMGLHYVLPSETQLAPKVNCKTALLIHAYYMDQMERTCQYASAMPEDADIYITTPHKALLGEIEKVFSKLPNKVEIRLIENRGRDVSSLLVGFADLIDQYDYLCFYHDKKVNQVSPKSVGSSFCYLVSESTLHGKAYVQNVLKTFDENPKLGMLSPVPPCHSDYYLTLHYDWGPNFDNTVNLKNQLGLDVPISKDKPPVAPLGTVFWFRGAAMKKLFAKKWKYTDFPAEPNGIDGTFLHAVERIYPYVVQAGGYYPAYVLPDFIASMELNMMTYYLRSYNKIFVENNMCGKQMDIRNQLQYRLQMGASAVNSPAVVPDSAPQTALLPQNRLAMMMVSPPFGVKEAFKIAVNKRFPLLFRKTAARFPADMRRIGLKDAINIWRVKRIYRKYA